jgi:hypothetical protein
MFAQKKEKENPVVYQRHRKMFLWDKKKAAAAPKKERKKKASVKKEPAPDISSGEEERKTKTRTRAKRSKRGRQPPELEELPQQMIVVESDGLPEIRDLAQLIKDNPHMCGDTSKPDRCVGAPVRMDEGKDEKKEEKKDDAKTSDKENPLSRPLEDTECQHRLDELPQVHAVVTDGRTWKDSDKVRLLRQGNFFLPLVKASLESELLAASGTWKHSNLRVYDFPACKRGEKCVGMDGDVTFPDGRPFKHILTSFMLPQEYQQFLKDGRAPQLRHPCVACLRVMLVDAVCAFRGGQALVADGKEVAELTMDEDMLLQSYRNLVDCEDGYHREFCLEPSDERWEGVVSPIATYRASFLVARKGRYGRPFIDQSALVWKTGVTDKPDVGESISNFSSGASS